MSYFEDTEDDSKRIAYLSGTATIWWLRSPYTSGTSAVYVIDEDGSDSNKKHSGDNGFRPALILPSNALFDPDTGEFVGVA